MDKVVSISVMKAENAVVRLSEALRHLENTPITDLAKMQITQSGEDEYIGNVFVYLVSHLSALGLSVIKQTLIEPPKIEPERINKS